VRNAAPALSEKPMTTEKRRSEQKAFDPAPLDAMLGSLIHKHPNIWVSMGDLESRVLRTTLDRVKIDRPVFIAGLARSGTTILLELFTRFEETCTHRYRDFPPVFTPYWWNWLVDHSLRQSVEPSERAHGDRIQVSPESPEAFEEPVWMAFFPALHDPYSSNLLDGQTSNPEFERFYEDHLRKLMIVRQASRYVSKGNYNISRLQYLQKRFPDARFVIPIREPAAHIASLMKQHALFCRAAGNNPKARDHLRWVGHYEFGADRVPINMGDTAVVEEIVRLWADNQETLGWALYWDHIYSTVARQLEDDPQLREATLLVRYEAFCRSPVETVASIMAHTGFEGHAPEVARFCENISLPTYYSWPYAEEDLAIIEEHTGATASRLGLSEVTSPASAGDPGARSGAHTDNPHPNSESGLVQPG